MQGLRAQAQSRPPQVGLPEGGLHLSTDCVTLVGHSFGASTVLSAASAIAKAGEEARAVADAAESDEAARAAAAPAEANLDAPSLAAAAPEVTVGAVVVLDPWISGYNCSTDGAAAAPTMALMTQSMMYDTNADAVGEVLGRVAARGETALFAELAESRHQEVNDWPMDIHVHVHVHVHSLGARWGTEAQMLGLIFSA